MLLSSIKSIDTFHEPWTHHIFRNALSIEQIKEVQNANVIGYTMKKNDGTRSGQKDQNNAFREYITKDNCDNYPHLLSLVTELQCKWLRNIISELTQTNLEKSWVRVELLRDTNNFWLKPHIDIPEKLVSCMIYINQTNEDMNLGTDLYNENEEVIKTIPFEHNLGFMFNGQNALHGLERKKNIKVDRRGLQINYVNFETDWPVT